MMLRQLFRLVNVCVACGAASKWASRNVGGGAADAATFFRRDNHYARWKLSFCWFKDLRNVPSWVPQRRYLIGATAVAAFGIAFALDYFGGRLFACASLPLYLLAGSAATWSGGIKAGLSLAAVIFAVAVPFGLGPETIVRAAALALSLGGVALLTDRLRRSRRREAHLAATDSLTGLFNRQYFFDAVERARRAAVRSGTAVSVLFLDCDCFKQINDRLGHLTGDEVLKAVGRTLAGSIPDGPVVARMGGDEFAVLLSGVSREEAGRTAEGLREALKAEMVSHAWPVTFSIGVATFSKMPDSASRMVEAADTLMYAVKRSGKDAVRIEEMAG
ncbi:MAG TPA: GGDEF domain-containing protein [Planctomycetaceae bacterium]|nr:GGDEF domain-containing protein [Planctomycetaceae bacterium]